MNLRDTIKALEKSSVTVALDIGVHENCNIDSNCPVAVDLRRIITSSGVTLEQILAGFAASQEEVPDPVNLTIPEIDGKVTVSIGTTLIPIDLTGLLKDEISYRFAKKMEEVKVSNYKLKELGRSLYNSYITEIYKLRETKTLPQVQIGLDVLAKTHCMVTSDGENYLYLFSKVYMPQTMHHDGIRYELSDADKKKIRRDVVLVFTVGSRSRKMIKAVLLDEYGGKLEHYHGGRNNADCWGMNRLPERWDGNVMTLYNLSVTLMGALTTINKDSLIMREPPGMPHVDIMLERATRMGEEGVVEERERPAGTWQDLTAAQAATVPVDPVPARNWGGRRT